MSEHRTWFAKPNNPDELEEALSVLRSMCEEMLLGHVEIRIDLVAKAKPLQDIAKAAGMVH